MELKYAELAISKIPHTPNDRIVKAVFFLFLAKLRNAKFFADRERCDTFVLFDITSLLPAI